MIIMKISNPKISDFNSKYQSSKMQQKFFAPTNPSLSNDEVSEKKNIAVSEAKSLICEH